MKRKTDKPWIMVHAPEDTPAFQVCDGAVRAMWAVPATRGCPGNMGWPGNIGPFQGHNTAGCMTVFPSHGFLGPDDSSSG